MFRNIVIVAAAAVIVNSTLAQKSFAQDFRVSDIGLGGPPSADERIVPGVSGLWLPSDVQRLIRDKVLAMERKTAADCSTPRITNSVTAAPIFARINGNGEQRLYHTWTIDRCGTNATYMAGIWSMPSGQAYTMIKPRDEMLVVLAEEGAHFTDAIEKRNRDRESGDWLDLNLPMPATWQPAFTSPASAGAPAIYEYLPKGQKLKKWKEMITIQVISGESRMTPEELTEGARQRRKELCGSEQEAVFLGNDGSASDPTAPGSSSAQVLLVCEKLPKTKKAEVTLAKALAGKNHLYYVHWGWRVRSGDRAKVLQELETRLLEARAIMDQVRLCNPMKDPTTCSSPFFL